MATLGFVGLGIMGRPMMNNLLKAGHKVVAYTRNADVLDACVTGEPSEPRRTAGWAKRRTLPSPCCPTALKWKK